MSVLQINPPSTLVSFALAFGVLVLIGGITAAIRYFRLLLSSWEYPDSFTR
jgi:uncharacterized membrane protein HdeD (DUF308 family)